MYLAAWIILGGLIAFALCWHQSILLRAYPRKPSETARLEEEQ